MIEEIYQIIHMKISHRILLIPLLEYYDDEFKKNGYYVLEKYVNLVHEIICNLSIDSTIIHKHTVMFKF